MRCAPLRIPLRTICALTHAFLRGGAPSLHHHSCTCRVCLNASALRYRLSRAWFGVPVCSPSLAPLCGTRHCVARIRAQAERRARRTAPPLACYPLRATTAPIFSSAPAHRDGRSAGISSVRWHDAGGACAPHRSMTGTLRLRSTNTSSRVKLSLGSVNLWFCLAQPRGSAAPPLTERTEETRGMAARQKRRRLSKNLGEKA